jgi:hypothetical protein
MNESLEVLVQGEGNLVARYRNVVLQVRSGDMTLPILQRIESAALLARASAGGSVGAIAIIEEGASLASADVRAAQAALVRRLLKDPRTHFVTVVVGQTVANRAITSVMRLLLLGVPRLRSVGTIEEAIAWLVTHVEGVSAGELRVAIEDARARLRAG